MAKPKKVVKPVKVVKTPKKRTPTVVTTVDEAVQV